MRRSLTLLSFIAYLAVLACPVFAQTPPASLQAQTIGTGQITLTWTAVAGASQYYVYLGTTSGGPYTTRSYSVTSPTTHLSIGSLSDAITYYAIVKTVVSGTVGAASQQVSVCSGSAQLAAPTNLVGTATSGQIALTWSSVPGATAYDVYRSPDAAGNQDGLLVSGVTGTAYTDSGVTNGTTYTYQVAAVCATGEGTQCGPVAATPLSPPALSAEATANQTQTEIDLSWTASTGATSYNLYRGMSPGGEGTTAYVAGIGGTAYADTSVTAGNTYYYTVVAVAGGSTSVPSGEVSAKAGSTLLAAPTLTVSAANAQASLSWTSVSGATYYDVYRAAGTGTPVFYAHVPSGTVYTDDNLSNGTTYVYQVAAGNTNGQGALSNSVSVTPLAAPTISATTISSSEIDLSWTVSTGATVYHLDRSTSSSSGPWTQIASPAGTTYQDTGLTAGTNYWYHLQAVNAKGSSNSSNSVLAETAAGVPTGLTATPGNAQVTLSWTAPLGAATYNVYRGTSAGGESTTPVATGIGGTTYTDTGLTNGTTYFYEVTAVNSAGEGPKSNEASARPPYGPPTLATAASASPNPATGTRIVLSALGTSPGGAANLTYTWSASPSAGVTFTLNGTNAAGRTAAVFTQAGTYTFTVAIADRYGASVSSSVTVTVVQTPANIVVTPAALSLSIGGTQPFTATLLDQFGTVITGQSFDWSVDNPNCSIDPMTGVFTAGFFAGTATVTATDGDVTGTASVTVTDIPPAVAVAASADPNPVTGTVTSLSVLGADVSGESTLRYTWSATGPAPVSFSDNGTNTAKNALAAFTLPGVYTLTATIEDDSGNAVTSSVTVTVNDTPTSVEIYQNPVSVSAGGGYPFLAYLSDQFGDTINGASFTWSVLSGTGTINSSGDFTAPTGAETDVVQAASGGVSGTAVVYVTGAGSPTVATAASATPNPVTGTTTALAVLGTDAAGESTLTYTWSVTSGPSGVTFSVNGTNAAKTTTATFSQAGTYVFEVTIADVLGSSITSDVTVTVSPTPTAVAVSPSVASLIPGATQQFSATAIDQFGDPMADDAVIWSVASGIGSINAATGLYSAGGTTGAAIVTATSGTAYGLASVTVATAVPTIATAASATPNPLTGITTVLSVLGADTGAGGESGLTYTWSAIGPGAVSYTANGTNAAKTATVTFTEPGSYVFTVTTADAYGASAMSTVDVTVSQTAGVTVSPAADSLTPGATQQFSAAVTDQFGNSIDSATVSWSVAPGRNGTINSSGLFTAPSSTETDTVTAASGSMSGTATVTVTVAGGGPYVVTSASASPSTVTDTTTTLSVVASDTLGNAPLTYTWAVTSGPPGVTYSDNGDNSASNTTATFAQVGTYVFTVTITDSMNLSTTSSVTVTVAQVPVYLSIQPFYLTVSGGADQQFTATEIDQFGNAMDNQPTSLTWAVTEGTGMIDQSGNYTAPQVSELDVVQANDNDIVGTVLVSVSSSDGLPTAPTGLSAVASDEQVALTWNETDSSVTSYNIYRGCTSGNESPTAIGNVTGSSGTGITFTDTNLTDGYAYYYVVTAVNRIGASVSSNEVSATPVESPPTITIPAHASADPVTGTSVTLSVSATSNVNPSNLTYTWEGIGVALPMYFPYAPVTFTPNGSSEASSTTATFTQAGDYGCTVIVTDAYGNTSTSEAAFYVDQTATSISIIPSDQPTIQADGYCEFGETVFDQFGMFGGPSAVTGIPGVVKRAVTSGTGSIDVDGLFTPAYVTTPETDTITATIDGVTSKTSINVIPVPAPGSLPLIVATASETFPPLGSDVLIDVNASVPSSYQLQSITLVPQGGGGSNPSTVAESLNNNYGFATFDLANLSPGGYTYVAEESYSNGSATLEADSAPVSVFVISPSVQCGSWMPSSACPGDTITGQAYSTASYLDSGGRGHDSLVYTWSTQCVYYSQDGTPGSFEPYNYNYTVEWQQGAANTSFRAVFDNPGFYIIAVSCDVEVYDGTTGQFVGGFNQTGYIGGDASDIDQSGGDAGQVHKSHAHHANAGGGIKGLQINASFFMVYNGAVIASNSASTPYESQSVMIGQKITLRYLYKGTMGNFQWGVPGSPLISYSQTKDRGDAEFFTTTSVSPISFYWITPGSYTVTVTGQDYEGFPITISATFIVKGVTVTSFTGKISTHKPPVFAGYNYNNALSLTFGDGSSPDNTSCGLICYCDITLPDIGGGQICIVQTIISSRTIYNSGIPGPPKVYKNPTGSDGKTPVIAVDDYQKDVNGNNIIFQNPKSVSGGTRFTNSGESVYIDAPSQPFHDKDIGVIVSEAYTAYLMYQPKNSDIWVGLASLKWAWSGTATNKSGKWYVVKGSDSPSSESAGSTLPSTCIGQSDQALLPTWATGTASFGAP